MSDPPVTETIAALATPPGHGGLAVVRVSGPKAIAIASLLAGDALTLRRAHYRRLCEDGDLIDDAIVIVFAAPHSFTGEDVVEFQIHGSPVVAARLLRACHAAGARPAAPGEFTERAWRNDRIDLAQAEAVADLIHANTEHAARLARSSLDGALSARLDPLSRDLASLRAWVEADLDFGETDLDDNVEREISARLDALIDAASRLSQGLAPNRYHQTGLRVVLLGAPNVGKSSLLNALSGEERAIVTDRAGTTRDLLEARATIAGFPLTLVDTAGVRETDDEVERLGLQRTRLAASAADVVFWVADLTRVVETAPPAGLRADLALAQTVPLVVLWNKADLLNDVSADRRAAADPATAGNDSKTMDATASETDHDPTSVTISAVSGLGFDALDRAVAEVLGTASGPHEGFSVRDRHLHALQVFTDELMTARSAAWSDLRAESLNRAADALDRLLGRRDPEALLGEIFAGFCIGK